MQQAVLSNRRKTTQHRYPMLIGIGALLTSLLISVANWYFYLHGQRQHLIQLADLQAIQQDNQALQTQNAALQAQLDDLSARMSQAENADNNRLLQHTLTKLYQENFNLTEELHFYQSLAVLNPHEKQQFPVNIKKFSLKPLAQGRTYRYRLVLTYLEKKGETQRGEVQLYVLGSLNGRKQRLKMQKSQDSQALNYEFRHFQRLSGILALPAHFKAEQVVVELNPANGKAVQQIFAWNTVLQTDF